MKKILLTLFLFTGYIMAQVIDLSPKDVDELRNKGVVIIDIRTEPEWIQTGIIEDSELITFFDMYGRYDIDKFMKEFKKYIPTKDTKFILVCRTGSRTKAVGDLLATQMGYKNAMHLKGGIYAWIRDNREVEEY